MTCIRPLTTHDVDAVHQIDTQCMISHVSRGWMETRFRECPEMFYVAIADGQEVPIGFVSGYRFFDPNIPVDEFNRHVNGLVSRISVVPEYRRRGVGTMLLNALEYSFYEYHRYRRSYVTLRRANTIAHNFYSKNGYIHEPRLDDPRGYTTGDEENRYKVVMIKELSADPAAYRFNTCVWIQ